MEVQNFQNVPPEEIGRQLRGNQSLAKMVADSMGIERFTEAALQLLKQPGLAACTQESVLGGLLKAAMFNFRLSPELGQCWLVPRKVNIGTKEKPIWAQVATFQIGYKGWIELAFRSGEVESFDSAVVWSGDTFDFEQGSTPFLKYKPCADPYRKGQKTHVWASATMRSGRVVFHVVDIQEVERHRMMSDTQTAWDETSRKKTISVNAVGIWGAHYDQMAKRVPMRYLCTLQLPKSEIMLRAIEADGSVTNIAGDTIEQIPIGEVEAIALPERLHDDLLAELETAQTADELKAFFNQRKKDLPPALKAQYHDAVLAIHAQKFTGNGKS
jgi:recombination protein RecT